MGGTPRHILVRSLRERSPCDVFVVNDGSTDNTVEMHRLKARTVEMPVRKYERAEGKSSITAFRAVYNMVKVTLTFLINRIRRFG